MSVNSFSGQPAIPTSYGFTAGKNKIINGDFYINQRNVSSTTTNDAFIFDRWSMIGVGGTTTTASNTFTAGTAPVTGYEGKTYISQAITGQTTQSQYSGIRQKIEDVRTFANQTVTLSFWAKAASGTPYFWVEYQQYFGTGGSPSATAVAQLGSTLQLSTTWTRYSVTGTIASIAGKTIGTDVNSSALQFVLWTSLGSSIRAYANATYQNTDISVWGVQLEAGSTATVFQTATGTIQGELAACQRYYWRNTVPTATDIGYALGRSTTQADIVLPLPVTMRTNPTAIEYGGGTFTLTDPGVSSTNLTGFTFVHASYQTARFRGDAASGLTQAKVYEIGAPTNGYIGFSAEL